MTLKIDILPFEPKHILKAVSLERKYFSVPWSENAFKETLNNSNSYFLCAQNSKNFIGYAGMYSVLTEGYIYNIAVDEKFRKHGVATKLINFLLERCNILNLEFLSLEVRKSNIAALNLYTKCGFKPCGTRKNFYTLPKEDALILTYNF